MYWYTYSTRLRFGITYTHSFGTDTHTWRFHPLEITFLRIYTSCWGYRVQQYFRRVLWFIPLLVKEIWCKIYITVWDARNIKVEKKRDGLTRVFAFLAFSLKRIFSFVSRRGNMIWILENSIDFIDNLWWFRIRNPWTDFDRETLKNHKNVLSLV